MRDHRGKDRGSGNASATAAAFPVRRILVVDDNRDTVDTEARLLEALGQSVQRAYDGPSALRIAAEFKPEIVFLDLDMPGMSGLEVARQLRALDPVAKARLVAYTGFARPEYRSAAVAAGFDDVILKPGTLNQLISILGVV